MKPKHSEDVVYAAVIDGELTIDNEGRVWRMQRRHAAFGTGVATQVYSQPRRAEHVGKYLRVRVMWDGVRHCALAHRLVWRHFFGEIEGDLTINHKDGDCHNNRPDNLELATAAEQRLHALRVLGRSVARGSAAGAAKVTESQVREIRRRRANGEELKAIGADYGLKMQSVHSICARRCWRHIV